MACKTSWTTGQEESIVLGLLRLCMRSLGVLWFFYHHPQLECAGCLHSRVEEAPPVWHAIHASVKVSASAMVGLSVLYRRITAQHNLANYLLCSHPPQGQRRGSVLRTGQTHRVVQLAHWEELSNCKDINIRFSDLAQEHD